MVFTTFELLKTVKFCIPDTPHSLKLPSIPPKTKILPTATASPGYPRGEGPSLFSKTAAAAVRFVHLILDGSNAKRSLSAPEYTTADV